MGTWGTAIFRDDEAIDIRGDFRDLIGLGKSSEAVTKRLMKEWRVRTRPPSVTDYEFIVWGRFWLFLAAAKWQVGRLDKPNRDRALKFIRNGGDAEDYTSPKAQAKRVAVLKRFAAKLEGRQPARLVIPPPKMYRTNWELGTVFAYRLRSGRYAMLRVFGFAVSKLDKSAVLEVIDWRGNRPPLKLPDRLERRRSPYDRARLDGIRNRTMKDVPKRFKSEAEFKKWNTALLDEELAKDSTIVPPIETQRGFESRRWNMIGVAKNGTRIRAAGSVYLGHWKSFDEVLWRDFGLR